MIATIGGVNSHHNKNIRLWRDNASIFFSTYKPSYMINYQTCTRWTRSTEISFKSPIYDLTGHYHCNLCALHSNNSAIWQCIKFRKREMKKQHTRTQTEGERFKQKTCFCFLFYSYWILLGFRFWLCANLTGFI